MYKPIILYNGDRNVIESYGAAYILSSSCHLCSCSYYANHSIKTRWRWTLPIVLILLSRNTTRNKTNSLILVHLYMLTVFLELDIVD